MLGRTNSSRAAGTLLVLALVAGTSWLCRQTPGAQPAGIPSVAATLATAEQAAQARALLPSLAVKGRSAAAGYSRAQFLPHGAWPSTGDGCTVRDRILRSQVTEATFRTRPACRLATGITTDAYSGVTVELAQLEVDHVVALKDAWVKGLSDQAFTPTPQFTDAGTARRAFAVDPLNLQAIAGATNSAKGDADAATWIPHSKSYRCTYGVRIVLVKARYGIWVTRAEHEALERLLDACP